MKNSTPKRDEKKVQMICLKRLSQNHKYNETPHDRGFNTMKEECGFVLAHNAWPFPMACPSVGNDDEEANMWEVEEWIKYTMGQSL